MSCAGQKNRSLGPAVLSVLNEPIVFITQWRFTRTHISVDAAFAWYWPVVCLMSETVTSALSATVWVFICYCDLLISLKLQWDTHTHTHTYRCTLCTATQQLMHASMNAHTYIHMFTHTHKSISQTVKRKVQRWTNRASEGPRTTAITLLHDSIQGTCPVTSKQALCRQDPKNMFVMLPSEGYVFPNLQVQV